MPAHCELLEPLSRKMIKLIEKYIPEPKLRSSKWVSTCVLDTNSTEYLRYASAQYFAHNLISPVLFNNRFTQIPEDAIVIELSPNRIFGKIVETELKSVNYINLIKKDSNDTNLETLLNGVSKLYELGLNPVVENLYPRVEWPVVRGTQSISSLMKWDHSMTYKVQRYPVHYNRSTASDMNVSIDLTDLNMRSYIDHSINNTIIYPATGYLMLAWRQMALFYGKNWCETGVVFNNVILKKAVILSQDSSPLLTVRYLANSGKLSKPVLYL